MKLIFCPLCRDVVSLSVERTASCSCGSARGKYNDYINATVSPLSVPIGFENRSFAMAVRDRPDRGSGIRFEAFVIPHECSTVNVENIKG